MISIKQRVLTYAKHTKRIFHTQKPRIRFVHQNVPYFSQWESPELVEPIVNKKTDAKDDPRWRESGAKTKEEYSAWSWNGCGMASTKMLLAKQLGRTIPLVELGKTCATYGGYPSLQPGSVGMLYAPYVHFLEKEFGLKAKVVSPLLIAEIIDEISSGNFVIASVSPQIRVPSSTPKTTGGHLILIVGYDLEKKTIFLHNPSGFDEKSQGYAEVSFADFKKFFGGRGIVIYT